MTQTSDETPIRVVPEAEADRLVAGLTTLRTEIVGVTNAFDTPEARRAELDRKELLDEIDSYLLPRLRGGDKPLLVTVAGSTGAGKSTLVNTLVGAQVSNTGVRRPTTNSPVLACHPDDAVWFGEDRFLPTLPRVRQQGLAMPGRDGMLVIAALDGMPRGLAVLDTPDIDSVVKEHHEFARQFLDTADVWLFVTTATRYADARVWDWLRRGNDRDAYVAVALSRVPADGRDELDRHFGEMLAVNGFAEADRFLITETTITDASLPDQVAAPVRAWLAELATDPQRRSEVVNRTLTGTLADLRVRVPELGGLLEEQLTVAEELRRRVDDAYRAALDGFTADVAGGSLLHGELLARWQELIGASGVLRALQAKRGGRREAHKRHSPTGLRPLETALHDGLQALVMSAARTAAADATQAWRGDEVGAQLVDGASETLARPADGMSVRVSRAISGWQDEVRRVIESEAVAKRSVARVVSFDAEALALVFTVGILELGAESGRDGAAGVGAVKLLRSLFGAGPLRSIGTRLIDGLGASVRELLDADRERFGLIIDSAGLPDPAAPERLYQAVHDLEAAG